MEVTIVFAKDIKLNLVPFGHRGKDKKEEFFPATWKKYQTRMCEKKVTENDNVVLITGHVPGEKYQIVVLDFDGELGKDDCFTIYDVLEKIKIPFIEIQHTGNFGLHYLYVCDDEVEIRNVQDRVLKPGVFNNRVKKVDVRANGGFIFYHSTEFSDSAQPYQSIYKEPTNSTTQIVGSSKTLQAFIDSLYTKPTRKNVVTMESLYEDVRILSDDRISCLRTPIRRLMMDGAPEIEDLAQQTGEIEELYWKAIWLEVLNKGVSIELAKRLLSKYQHNYQEDTTNHQIPYLYKDNGQLWPPFKSETLERMFPGWKSPQSKKFKGFREC